MALPIVFFHYGNPKYLKYSLKQARHFNPDAAIYLLGDSSNDHYPFVEHVPVAKYDEYVAAFTNIYKHWSANNERYELQCFLRWFYIEAFCREHNIGPFIYLDSDVLLFENVTTIAPFLQGCSIANTGDVAGVPAFTYFSGCSAIKDFCNYMMRIYTDQKLLQQLKDFHESPDAGQSGDISDMILFQFYFREYPAETKKLDLINNELAVDQNINHADGYETKKGIKKIHWQNNRPYCKNIKLDKLIRFVSFHYQGDTKGLMIKHYQGGGYALNRFLESVKVIFKKTKKSVKRIFR